MRGKGDRFDSHAVAVLPMKKVGQLWEQRRRKLGRLHLFFRGNEPTVDDNPSWIVISELNDFVWPGPDLRPIPGKTDCFDYGVLPPAFFRKLQEAIFDRLRMKKIGIVPRT
jgi:hypothetical protein